jgi:SulP family sulfate permease
MFPRRDDRETIIASMERESIEAGRYVIRQGEPARALFLLESGELAAQLEIEGKEPVRLRTMRPGTVFGEIALYLGTPRSVAVTATRPSSIYRLTEDALSLLKKNTPELAIEFQAYIIRLLSERLVDLNRTIAALSE